MMSVRRIESRFESRCGLSRIVAGRWLVIAVLFWVACSSEFVSAQFFVAGARPEEDDGGDADWTIADMMLEADEALDRQWDDRLKQSRLRAKLYFDEIVNSCQLGEAERRRLEAASKGVAFKLTMQWRNQIQTQIASTLRHYHQQGWKRARAKQLISQYTSGNVHFGRSGDENSGAQGFWKRAVASTLDKEQRKKLEEREKLRAERKKRVYIEQALVMLDESLRLTPEQEEKFRKMFAGTSPAQFGMGMMVMEDGIFRGSGFNSWTLMQMLQRKSARKILSETQWGLVKAQMEQQGGFGMVAQIEDEDEDEEKDEKEKEGDHQEDGAEEDSAKKDGKAAGAGGEEQVEAGSGGE